MSLQKQVTDISLVLKDIDMESENLSSLFRLSVSDGQKNIQFKTCIIYRYYCRFAKFLQEFYFRE